MRTRLNKAGYSEYATTPGLWKHTWRPIQCFLIVDDFGIEYMREKHAHQLHQALQENDEILEDWKGEKIAGIDLEWNYAPTHNDLNYCLSIKGYIETILTLFCHKIPTTPQLSPHKHREIHYGAKVQVSPDEITRPNLDATGIKRVQTIVGAVLFYG